MKKKVVYLAFAFTIVVLLGLGAGSSIGRFRNGNDDAESGDAMAEALAPASLEQLVHSSDVIAVGTFEAIVNEGQFYGYDKDAAKRAETDRESLTPLSVPITDFEFSVERLLLGDGRRPKGEPLIVRFVAERTEQGMPQLGDRRLLFLRVNPDNRTYGMTSFVSQIDLTGDTAVFYRGHQAMLPFGRKFRPEALIGGVEDVLARRSPMKYKQ